MKGYIKKRGKDSWTLVFKFDRIQSTSVQTKQSRAVVSLPQSIFPGDVRPLGGQSGGQNSARADARRYPRSCRHSRRRGPASSRFRPALSPMPTRPGGVSEGKSAKGSSPGAPRLRESVHRDAGYVGGESAPPLLASSQPANGGPVAANR